MKHLCVSFIWLLSTQLSLAQQQESPDEEALRFVFGNSFMEMRESWLATDKKINSIFSAIFGSTSPSVYGSVAVEEISPEIVKKINQSDEGKNSEILKQELHAALEKDRRVFRGSENNAKTIYAAVLKSTMGKCANAANALDVVVARVYCRSAESQIAKCNSDLRIEAEKLATMLTRRYRPIFGQDGVFVSSAIACSPIAHGLDSPTTLLEKSGAGLPDESCDKHLVALADFLRSGKSSVGMGIKTETPKSYVEFIFEKCSLPYRAKAESILDLWTQQQKELKTPLGGLPRRAGQPSQFDDVFSAAVNGQSSPAEAFLTADPRLSDEAIRRAGQQAANSVHERASTPTRGQSTASVRQYYENQVRCLSWEASHLRGHFFVRNKCSQTLDYWGKDEGDGSTHSFARGGELNRNISVPASKFPLTIACRSGDRADLQKNMCWKYIGPVTGGSAK